MKLAAPFTMQEKNSLADRHITTNHKTGTFMARCLRAVLARAGIKLEVSSGHTWGFESISLPKALQINLVRDPFFLVYSGYMYHRGTARAERWTIIPFNKMGTRYDGYAAESTGYKQGALDAQSSFRTCSNVTVSDQATYRSALNTLTLADGLLLECLRALHRDVPYVVASAVACYHVGESTKSAIAPKGRCNNVLLEDVMADFTRAFKRHLAVPLNIPADSIHTLGASFAQKCDPSLVSPGHIPLTTMGENKPSSLSVRSTRGIWMVPCTEPRKHSGDYMYCLRIMSHCHCTY